MQELIYCLDSGTTSVKAAALDGQGRMVALSEQPNEALSREGNRVEQDMARTLAQALRVLRACVHQVQAQGAGGARAQGLIITGQGEGLWPVDRRGEPLGNAMTWLDGRASTLARSPSLADALGEIAAITSSRPSPAAPSLQLLWMKQNRPDAFARMGHVLRAKEWLFHGLTGEVVSEPSTAMLAWGSWRSQQMDARIPRLLGLGEVGRMLPEVFRTAQTLRPLTASVARATSLPQGLPVLLGPSDVQATALGLGVGVLDDVNRASIFGTSAVHVGHFADAQALPERRAAGAMLQASVRDGGYFCIFPGLNGTTVFRHLSALTGAPEHMDAAAPSGVMLQPFFESGGERAPITDALARASLVGVNAQTTREELAWAGREALAFNARMSHEAMGAFEGRISMGGGLAQSACFSELLASLMQRPLWRPESAHAGLLGIGLMAAAILQERTPQAVAAQWLAGAGHVVQPMDEDYVAYLQRKYAVYGHLLSLLQPAWSEMQALQTHGSRLRVSARC